MKQILSKLPGLARGRAPAQPMLTAALALHALLLPAVPGPVQAGAAKPPEDSIQRAVSDATFHRVGTRHTLKGRNGVKLTTFLGRWRAGGSEVQGAMVRVKSAWGEELNVDIYMSDDGMLALFNEHIQVFTTLDAGGRPLELGVTVDGETTTTYLGNRAELFAAGAPPPADLDLRAHHALAMALQAELSPAFLKGLEGIERPAQEVACMLELGTCLGAIAAWVIDVSLLPGACLVAGVPTFGVSCALAVIGHELASAAVATSCARYGDCRRLENIAPEEVDESTPIVLDMDGRGFRLTGLDDPVSFDLTGDGKPERVSWTARDSDEAFLALDRNGNGRIDDGRELFGSRTPLVDGAPAEHGFWALIEYDLPAMAGNQNGAIDAGDEIFDRLVLWTDRNHDGISDPDEVESLRQAGVISLSLDYKVSERRDRHGNRFVLNSKALVRVRNHQQRRAMSDIYFRIAR